jgi:hypothetical protein
VEQNRLFARPRRRGGKELPTLLLGGWPDVVDPLGREASGDLKDPEADQ